MVFLWPTILGRLTESKAKNIPPHDVILLSVRQWDAWVWKRDLADITIQKVSIYYFFNCLLFILNLQNLWKIKLKKSIEKEAKLITVQRYHLLITITVFRLILFSCSSCINVH